jgi:hypothetical protein
MWKTSIQTELRRLSLPPINLDVLLERGSSVLLRGTLLTNWKVPRSIDGQWLLELLKGLPDLAGAMATMDAYYSANVAKGLNTADYSPTTPENN